ncbi:unnamed protein product [Caenorhabditis brenneri]
MARRSARLIAAGISKTASHSQDSVYELAARQAKEIEDLKKKLKKKHKDLDKEKKLRSRQVEEEFRCLAEADNQIRETLAAYETKKAVIEESNVLRGLKQRAVEIMKRQLQEEVSKNGESFGWQVCQICYFEFSGALEHTPRILSCGHTYCFDCLATLCKNSTVQCPFCRTVTNFTNGVPENLAVLELCE